MTSGVGSKVAAEFDAKAPSYESDRLGAWYRAQARLVLDALEGPPRGPVLDIGCGTGFLLRELLRRYPGTAALGIDISGEMIRQARIHAEAEGLDDLSLLEADWEDPSARNLVRETLTAPPSVATCVSTMHYFADPERAFAGIRDTLAPDGHLLVVDRAMDGSAATTVWDLLHRYVIRDEVRFYRTDELVALLREAGFARVEVVGRVRALLWHGKLYTSLALLSARRGTGSEGATHPT